MADTTEIGAPGLRQFGGQIREEFLPELTGQRGIKVYQEMESNDAVVGAVLFALTMLMRRVEWRTDPASDAPEDKAAAAFVEECRGDMSASWGDFLSEALSFMQYGWSFHEIVYKLRQGEVRNSPGDSSLYTDGKIGWRKLPIRSQSSLQHWEFAPDGGLLGMVQASAPSYRHVLIPMEKALLFRTVGAKGNPEGRSVLRTSYRSWYFKKRIQEIEGIGAERDLAGLPVLYVPHDWTQKAALNTEEGRAYAAALTEYDKLVSSIRRDEQEGIRLPAIYNSAGNQLLKLELLTSGGKRQFDTRAMIAGYNQEIAMSVLADFILLGHEGTGSYSLGVSKAELFVTAIETFLGCIRDVFNRHAIPRLLGVNGMSGRCGLAHGDVDRVNLTELSTYITALSGAEVVTRDDTLEDHLRRLGRLPPAEVSTTTKRRSAGFRKAARRSIRGRAAKAEGDADALYQIADALAPRLRKRFLAAVAAVREEAALQELVKAIAAGDLEAAQRAVAFDRLTKEFAACVEELGRVFEECGSATVARLGERASELAFDTASPRAVAWVQTRGAELVTQVTDTSRAAIRVAVERAIVAGAPPESAAKQIIEQVGLTERDARATERFAARLRDAGADEAEVERRAAKYARRKLEDRAELIAEHETLEAAGAGRQEAWTQATEEGLIEEGTRREVIPGEDENTCTICAGLKGKTFGMEEDIIPGKRHTPLHVKCRCPEVLVFPD